MAGDPKDQAPGGQILLYRSEYGRTKLDVRLEHETVWVGQRQLTDLFGKAKGTISEHIKHIFEDGELTEDSVVRYFRTTGPDGNELPVLASSGSVSHEEALDWANRQYDAFADRRREEAEPKASARYFDDLEASARLVESRSGERAPKLRRPHGKKTVVSSGRPIKRRKQPWQSATMNVSAEPSSSSR
jgi:hypothetical protein